MSTRFLVRFLCLCVAAAFITGCAGDGQPPEKDCLELRDHVAAIKVRARIRTNIDDPRVIAEAKKHTRTISAAMGDSYIAECKESMSGPYIECAMGAATEAELSQCEPMRSKR